MLFALFLLLSPLPQAADAATAPLAQSPAAIERLMSGSPASAGIEETARPAPKLEASDAPASDSSASYAPGQLVLQPIVRVAAESSSADPIPARSAALPATPPRPAFRGQMESPAQRHMWYALGFAGHGAAAFDAWSTRRAITSGAGEEANPTLRPFAHSNFLYVATQVSPAVMDYVGRRMMTNRHHWVRKMWWLPQSAGTAISLFCGVHNVRLVQ